MGAQMREGAEDCLWEEGVSNFGWISVEEKLPEQGKAVLLCNSGHVVWGYRRSFPGKGAPYQGVHGVIRGIVTHWMPLPAPPV